VDGSQGRRSSADPDLVLYQVVASRRQTYDQLLWQAPSLALAAQAFLMTIALGPGTGRAARVVAGLLAFVISVMCIQLLLRQRVGEVADSIWLGNFERSHGWEVVHEPATRRAERMGRPAKGVAGLRSHVVWTFGLSVFAAVGLGSAGVALLGR
jgi:hypothetical protein